MKRTVRLTESELRKMISESVKRVLNEWEYDNDLQYERIYDEASHYIIKNQPPVQDWRGIAQAMGYQLDTIGPNDMETLKDAIEQAMMEN